MNEFAFFVTLLLTFHVSTKGFQISRTEITTALSTRCSETDSKRLFLTNNDNDDNFGSSRRSFMEKVATIALASFTDGILLSPTQKSEAAMVTSESQLTDVYFGVGCYWHIQHEFLLAEKSILGRGEPELTSRTGYAGGTSTGAEGRVCYHNMKSIADYGKLGHGEVVGMRIPESSVSKFAEEYFNLFTAKGERVDPGDKGPEYRALLGLPGGTSNDSYSKVDAAAQAKGMSLKIGKGNDPDTLGTKSVFVYDSNKFPFYQAEVYHQYHDDFQSPAYGKAYNALGMKGFDEGRIKSTGCPDIV